jgi:Protein of unknown function (DUF2855)
MKFIDRQLPLLSWIAKARRSRFIPKNFLSKYSQQRVATRRSREFDLKNEVDKENPPVVAALQFQLGRKRNIQFLELDARIDQLSLEQDDVLFLPTSLGLNRYITYYNSGYILNDIESFVDPKGVLNSDSFKTIPAWGSCVVYRSNNPAIEEGSIYYGFWPIAPYSVRAVVGINDAMGIAFHYLPKFTGPKEWLKLVKMEDFDAKIAVNFEYIKIGITYALELHDMNYFEAERLVISSASSMSGQIIAMCLKELKPALSIIGLTSQKTLELVKQLPFFDEAYTYEDVKSSPNANLSLYFDALGSEKVTLDCFEHFKLARWWIYGEGGERTFFKFLKKNRKGTFYSNLADSYVYALQHGISDAEIMRQFKHMNDKYDLEKKWGHCRRVVSSSKELRELYQSFIKNTQAPGEKVLYQSPFDPTKYTSNAINSVVKVPSK